MYKKPYIIAEVAQGYAPIFNSKASIEIAILLVKAAAKSGANAVKFQMIYAEELADADYEYYQLFKELKFSKNEWMIIRKEAYKYDIDFHVDIFGEKSLSTAKYINADAIKIHSTSFFNEDFVIKSIQINKPIFISIGGINPEEIIDFIEKHKLKQSPNVTLMYGFQSEPTLTKENNLSRINELANLTAVEIGFMDHADASKEDKVNISILALAMGVVYFEKHITLDRALELEDYISGLTPKEFKNYTQTINRLFRAMGSKSLKLTKKEIEYRNKAICSITAKSKIEKGTRIEKTHIRFVRKPNDQGLLKPADVIDKSASKIIAKGSPIKKNMLYKK